MQGIINTILSNHPQIQIVGDTYPIVVSNENQAYILSQQIEHEGTDIECTLYNLSDQGWDDGPVGIAIKYCGYEYP